MNVGLLHASCDIDPATVEQRMRIAHRSAVEVGRDPRTISLTVRPTMTPALRVRPDQVQRFMIDRILISVNEFSEAARIDAKQLGRALGTYHERVVRRLA